MARIRSIKPEFFTSLTIASLSIQAQMTFIGLWTHADDEGRCVDDARLIKAAVWPLTDRLASDVELDLKELTESSLITRYKVGERSYLAVTNWHEHQRINRPTPSKLPPPPDPTSEPKSPRQDGPRGSTTRENAALTDSSGSPHEQLSEDSPPERKGTGNREQGKEQGTGRGAQARTTKPQKQVPRDFSITDEMRRWAQEHTPTIAGDLPLQVIRFVNYWTERAERGHKEALKTDAGWARAWQNWLTKAVEIQSGRPTAAPSSSRAPHQPYREAEDRRNDIDYWSKGL